MVSRRRREERTHYDCLNSPVVSETISNGLEISDDLTANDQKENLMRKCLRYLKSRFVLLRSVTESESRIVTEYEDAKREQPELKVRRGKWLPDEGIRE